MRLRMRAKGGVVPRDILSRFLLVLYFAIIDLRHKYLAVFTALLTQACSHTVHCVKTVPIIDIQGSNMEFLSQLSKAVGLDGGICFPSLLRKGSPLLCIRIGVSQRVPLGQALEGRLVFADIICEV